LNSRKSEYTAWPVTVWRVDVTSYVSSIIQARDAYLPRLVVAGRGP
jgi:hypothetical protein